MEGNQYRMIRGTAFSADGNTLASVLERSVSRPTTLIIWTPRNGRWTESQALILERSASGLPVAISPDGTTLATPSLRGIHIWLKSQPESEQPSAEAAGANTDDQNHFAQGSLGKRTADSQSTRDTPESKKRK